MLKKKKEKKTATIGTYTKEENNKYLSTNALARSKNNIDSNCTYKH